MTGTSMAAPHAAGLLALAKAQFPGESARELVDRARFSVDPVAGLSSYCMSGGRINVAAALGDRPRMTNASGLVQVNTGAAVAIAGISIGGSSSKRVLFRAWGPSLASVGVTGHMSNPQITVFNAGGSSIGSNNDWGSLSLADRNEIATYGLTPLNSLDSAWIGTLAPGSYSVHLAGVGGTTGIGLIEAFDVDGSNVNRLVNTSVRAHVTSGQPAVGGLIVQGSKPRQVYIRVWGPSLTALGISGALSDPIPTLYDSMSNVVATNDDWAAFDSTSTALETRLIELGSAPQHNKDAAIVAKLNPGAYTLHVSGVGGASGIALFEFSEY